MNGEHFECWVLTKVIPNLEVLSLIIMGIESYCTLLLEKGQDNCLAARKKNPYPRGIFKSDILF
jgi:hypothetical protein